MTLKKETGGVGKDTTSQNQKHCAEPKVNPKQEEYNPFQADKEILIVPKWLLSYDILPLTMLLYGLLRKIAGSKGSCFAGVKYMARELCVSDRQVKRALKELVSVNLIRRDSRFSSTTLTYFLKPNDQTGMGTSTSPLGDIHVPTEGTSTSPYKVKQYKVHTKGVVCPAAAEAPAGKEIELLADGLKDASGLTTEKTEVASLDFSGSKPDSEKPGLNGSKEIEDYLFKTYPRIVDAEHTRIVIKNLVEELDDADLNVVAGMTKYYADLVEPLKEHPEQWVYVTGSFKWFKQRVWEHWTGAQMKAWVNEKLKEVGDF